jgi:hypothetical protein
MRRTLALLGLLLSPGLSLSAQQFSLVIDAKPNMKALRDVVGERFTFICQGNLQIQSVYGTDRYTDDSPICTAAVHAGVIQKETGGAVTLLIEEGVSAYPASTRNGVSSASWTSYDRHYVFVSGSGGQIDWGTSATKLPKGFTTPLDLFCPPGAAAYLITKSVYGTDLYTDTTPICVAAVHAGVIGLAGGDVRMTPRGPQASFTASSRNGITSRAYGSWEGSYSLGRVTSPARVSDVQQRATAIDNPALRIAPATLPSISQMDVVVDSLDNILGRTLRYGPIAPVDSLDNMIGRLGRAADSLDNMVVRERVDSLDNIVARIVYPRISKASITQVGGTSSPQLRFSLLDAGGAAIPATNIETYSLPVTWSTSSPSCGFADGLTATGPTVTMKSAGCTATVTATIKRPIGSPSSLPTTKSATFTAR